jgi:hypothetical protein
MLIKVACLILWKRPFSWLYGGLVGYIAHMFLSSGILEQSLLFFSSLSLSHLSWVSYCKYAFSRPVLSFPLSCHMCQRTRYSHLAGPVSEYEDT